MQLKFGSDSQVLGRLGSAVRPAEWPINEILLQDLIMKNLNDTEIAQLFGVSADDVAMPRETYSQ